MLLEIRVVFLVQRFPGYGGAEEYVHQLALRLPDNGVNCTVLTSDLDKRNIIGLPASVKIVKLPVFLKIGEYAFWKGLLKASLGSDADVFHLNTYGYFHTDLVSLVHRLKNFKVVLTAHGFHGLDLSLHLRENGVKGMTFLAKSRYLARPLYDFTLGMNEIISADALVALSKRDIEIYKWMGAEESKIHEIPQGVRDVFFEGVDEEVETKMQQRLDGDPILLSVGELSWVKGKDIPLRALASLVKEYPRAKLVYVGRDGGLFDYLKELSVRLGVERNVLFEGFVSSNELIKYYGVADVLVHTSFAEGLSTVILEAMAAGLPVVSTPAGGNAQLLQKSNAGIIVPFNNPDSFCSAVNRILGDGSLRRVLGANGSLYALSNLKWTEIIKKYLSLYRSLSCQVD